VSRGVLQVGIEALRAVPWHAGWGAACQNVFGQVFRFDGVGLGEDDSMLHGVPEFAHVARKDTRGQGAPG